MKSSILINANEIETCWQNNDVCFIRMKSGKTWVCEKETLIDNNNILVFNQVRDAMKMHSTITIPLKPKNDGGYYGR